MKRIYANLLGDWVDITDDGLLEKCNPNIYIDESIQDMFKYDYINVSYNGKDYRIHPTFIQVVTV